MNGATATIGLEDERFHTPGPESRWSDSLCSGGGDPRGLAFCTRVGRRPDVGRGRPAHVDEALTRLRRDDREAPGTSGYLAQHEEEPRA